METRGVHPDTVSVNTILGHCKRQKNEQGAIEILERVSKHFRFSPDEWTYQILFSLARKMQLHTMTRAIWRYACLDAMTNAKMRQKVLHSLRNHIVNGFSSLTWYPVQIMSNSTSSYLSMQEKLEQLKSSGNVSSTSVQQRNEEDQNEQQWQLAKEVLEHDLKLYRDWEPQKPFAEMLVEALKIDKEWRARGIKKEDRLSWLSENAPVVPLRRHFTKDNAEVLKQLI